MVDQSDILELLVKLKYLDEGQAAALADIKRIGETAEGSGQKVEKEFNVHGRELYRVANLINRAVPGAGEALRAFAKRNDEGALAMIGVVAVAEILITSYKQMAANAKAADTALASMLEDKGDTKAVQAIADAWNEATNAQESYRRSLIEKASDEMDPTKGLADRALNAAKTYASAQEQINDAQRKLGIASIDEMEKQGVISHQQAIINKLKLDADYEAARLKLQHDADSREVDIKTKTAEIVKGQMEASRKDEAEAATAATAAHTAAERNKSKIEELRKTEEAGKKEQKESGVTDADAQRIRELYQSMGGKDKNLDLQGQASFVRSGYRRGQMSGMTFEDQLEVNGLFGAGVMGGRDLTNAQIAAYQGGGEVAAKAGSAASKLEKLQQDLNNNAENAKTELERQKHLLDEKTEQLNKLQTEVQVLKAESQAREQNAATVSSINLKAEAVKEGAAKPTNPFAVAPIAATEAVPTSGIPTSGATGPIPFEQTGEGMARQKFTLEQSYADVIAGGGTLDEHKQKVFEGIAKLMLGHKASNKELADLVTELHSTLVTDREDLNKKLQNMIDAYKTVAQTGSR